jgi:hypothetical protein
LIVGLVDVGGRLNQWDVDRRLGAVPAAGFLASEPRGRAELPDVHASPLSLRWLREDGLISDDEFGAKRVVS